jgi:hypothetical protein
MKKNKVNLCEGCIYKKTELCGYCIENPSRRRKVEKSPWKLEVDGKITIVIEDAKIQEADVAVLQKKMDKELLKVLKRRF